MKSFLAKTATAAQKPENGLSNPAVTYTTLIAGLYYAIISHSGEIPES